MPISLPMFHKPCSELVDGRCEVSVTANNMDLGRDEGVRYDDRTNRDIDAILVGGATFQTTSKPSVPSICLEANNSNSQRVCIGFGLRKRKPL